MLICLVLLVPILPFLLLGGHLELWGQEWLENPPTALVTASILIGLLATDIFLPVPSSVVSTLGGRELGVLGGTAVSWLGMTLGAMIGFVLARRLGHRFASWFSKHEEIERMTKLSDRFGPLALFMVRGVPLLAEASVLLVGMHRLAWRRFLPPVLIANLVLSFAYSAFADLTARYDWFVLAIGASIALPVLLATIVRRWWLTDRSK